MFFKVWDKFEMKTMKDYQKLNLKCYVYVCYAEVFQKVWNNSLKEYGLCPSHYLHTTALSWDAMLNMTKFDFELISDADIYSLKKVWEAELLIFLRDIVKPTISI